MEGREHLPVRKEQRVWDSDAFRLAIVANGGAILEEAQTPRESIINEERFASLPPQILRAMELEAKIADDYLTGPVIQDSFNSDEDVDPWVRRNWRQSLITEFGDEAKGLLEMNRMRLNRMQSILGQSDRLRRKLDEAGLMSEEAAEVRSAVQAILEPMEPLDDFGTRYKQLSLNERTVLVRAISAAAQAYLDLVTMASEEERQVA